MVNNNNEFPLPKSLNDNGNKEKRRTARHLPNFFRTNSNKKFLGGTLDALTQPGTLTKISSYVGRRDIPNYTFDDNYVQETSSQRQYYQLEPSFVNEDPVTGNVQWFADYLDYINILRYFGVNVANHSKLNKEEAYTWNPHIDWDKFTNYREYYWLPGGPDPITIYGELESTESTFTVNSIDQGDNVGYMFTPDGLTVNPRLTLYRGLKYTFKINTPNKPFSIKTQITPGDSNFYDIGVSSRKVDQGIVTFEVPFEAPDLLYYMDNNSIDTAGMIDIRDIREASFLNVENEIVGKQNFTSSTGVEFINGLKIKFVGQIEPAIYANGFWYVEGVGDRIKLIKEDSIEIPAAFTASEDVPFDDQPFDSLPWDNADSYPFDKDYIVINRASRDRNNWTRNNRWFHRNVLEVTAKANNPNIPAELNQEYRAVRPIIEFEPDLKLYNHGYLSKTDIDLVDTTTKDVFSIIEGSSGYIVDGEQLYPGYKVLFTADTDSLVNGRIFEVKNILNVFTNANEEITVTSTSGVSNTITVVSTEFLSIGRPVKFLGVPVGGLTTNEIYYIIAENFSPTTFSVSKTKNGPIYTLTTSNNLTMKVSDANISGVTQRKNQITLVEIEETQPIEGQVVYIKKGKTYKGSSFHYENNSWKLAQKKSKVNQAPLFDLYDDAGVSYGDTVKYSYNNFKGTRIFGYKIGSGTNDVHLGFPIVYRNINNIGDIEFEFDIENDTWTYIKDTPLISVQAYEGFLRKWTMSDTFEYVNGWIRTDRDTEQNVVRILQVNEPTYLVPIDVYDDDANLTAIEEASRLNYGTNFYISLQNSVGSEISDEHYWNIFDYKTKYKGEWDWNLLYNTGDIVRYNNSMYVAINDVDEKSPTNELYWSLLGNGYNSRGEYSPIIEYKINDVVTFNGLVYIAIKNNINVYPSDINNWKKLIKEKAKFKGEYDETEQYSFRDIVSYGLYLYVAKSDNAGNLPTDSLYWTLLSSGSNYPNYFNSETFYKEGDIVVLDSRPPVDYKIRVYVNDQKRTDLSLEVIDGKAYIKFANELNFGDKVVYKIRSLAYKNIKGYYEIPYNWQNNPLNDTLKNFTFGEIVDHTRTIVENSGEFEGIFPGISNLSNLGNITNYGRKFMQHSGPMSISSFFLIDKTANIVKSIRWAAREYSEFKKDILTIYQKSVVANTQNIGTLSSFTDEARTIVDQLLNLYRLTTKFSERSAFYYSDMIPYDGALIRDYKVEDPRFPLFIISNIFDPFVDKERSILVYLNESQLLYGKDYLFEKDEAFVKIITPLNVGDNILIKEYSNTHGCYIPFTPTKLGLYPLYEPKIFIDDTYTSPTPVKVIQGHDGSIIKAYDDIRDEIILEIEKRIYNNIRVQYDSNIFDLNDVLGGYYRKTDFSKQEVNDILMGEFLRWNSILKLDFNTSKNFIIDEESFTYTYNNCFAPNKKESLYGYWRGIYKYFYDTDRPHTHPWEMQGFTIKPYWWDSVYGLPPYTSENKILWDAIEQGVINDPENVRINLKYARPGLKDYLPVNDQGNLLSPLSSNLTYNFSKVNANGRYKFGDQGPVETVWRRSSEFPFAVIIAMCTLRGAEFIGKMWDRFTIKRNIAGQIYSTVTKKRITPADLPNSNEILEDGTRVKTSGLSNFIEEYIQTQKNIDYDFYKKTLSLLNVKLRYRLGGYSSEDKIKVLLDSRSPNASGTIFLPQENYKIFYNKSAPVETASYSGVIIEKRENGFAIDGYDKEKNVFEIFPPRVSVSDPTFNVGGISDTFVEWTPEKYYIKGQTVRYNYEFYKAKVSHSSTSAFTEAVDKWQKLPKLPIVGGRDAIRRTKFFNTPVRIPYGTVFTDIQSVVDFLLGYQERLKTWGFEFEQYSTDLELPLNWLTSAKEFMFWTLQNWAPGAIITLSPSANNLKFKPAITASVDNLDTDFYEYSIFKADGMPLKEDLTNIYREDNGFQISPTEKTRDGIFHIRTNLVYSEHVILFDNESIFGDVVYDVVPGYRQGRIKLLGFKTNEWDGSYFSPGFVYDKAEIIDWQPNVDYKIGDIVRYQNYYYTALNNILVKDNFDYKEWEKLDTKPTPKLLPNFDYKVEQFRDFYNLDSNNFDPTQQAQARHLVGYQPRQYLENIIIDDISQYKFYQGFIKEKGTLNSITKLFDALRSSGFSSIDIKEEWAFKVGDFGASDAYTEIEFPLDELKYFHNPQNVVLTLPAIEFYDSTIYNIAKNDVAKKPVSYNAKPFKTVNLDHSQNDYGVFKYKVAGYVKEEDVNHIFYNYSLFLNSDINLFAYRDKVWIGDTPSGDWDVLEYLGTNVYITNWEISGNILTLYCSNLHYLNKDDVIIIKNLDLIDGMYKVQRAYETIIEVFTFSSTLFRIQDDSTVGTLFKFESVRFKTSSDIKLSLHNEVKIHGEKIWVDTDSSNSWAVLENHDAFTEDKLDPPPYLNNDFQLYGYEIKISDDKRYMFVSATSTNGGAVVVYSRPNNVSKWKQVQSIRFPKEYSLYTGKEFFGHSIDITSDNKILAISAPGVSYLNSDFRGIYNPSLTYYTNDVVKYNNVLYSCLTTVVGDGTITINNPTKWVVLQDIYEVNMLDEKNSGLSKQGAVFIYVYDNNSRRFEIDRVVKPGNTTESDQIIASYDPQANERFGSKVKIIKDGNTIWLFVAGEGADSNKGRVQIFKRTSSGWKYNDQKYLDFTNVLGTYPSIYTPTIGSKYGHDISVNENASKICVSAPYLKSGAVYYFERIGSTFKLIQVIDLYTFVNQNSSVNPLEKEIEINDNDIFGYSITLKNDHLLISAPGQDTTGFNKGAVYYFKYDIGSLGTNTPFKIQQLITIPAAIINERAGIKIDINPEGTILAVGSVEGDTILETTFDYHAARADNQTYILDRNSVALDGTTFDKNTTRFYDRFEKTGCVYIYNKFDNNFIYADKLIPVSIISTEDHFGFSIEITDDSILVGAPNYWSNDIKSGAVFIFNYSDLSWKTKETQSSLVDIHKFKKCFIYDTSKNELITNLDFVDPAKGRIPGIADQEIKYQTYYDPAIYEFGVESETAVDKTSPWTDEHVGEIWWDLSTVKFMWYEQGDSSYRNTNWGRTFPGSTIDIYEWVETTYLPSRWAELSETEVGLSLGITGMPKNDDFTYSTKNKYDSVSQTKTTMYYYWVKDKNTVPRNAVRSLTALGISRLIEDPKSQGYKFISVTGENSISLTNINSNINDKNTSINIQFYEVDNTELLVHREYAIISEDDAFSKIPLIIENKWFDSLIGYNVRGQPVPDTRLSFQQKYGSSNEPRQSWFRNRFEALKQLFEYVNSVIAKKQLVDEINFTNLLRADTAPTIYSGDIDEIIDVVDELKYIGTNKIRLATLELVIREGKIINVFVIDSGYGYKVPPTIKVTGTGTGAELKAVIDDEGKITSVKVIKSGERYDTYSTTVSVRYYTVLVRIDNEAANGWSLYRWDNIRLKWERVRTQAYDVTRYWSYKDWYAEGYSSNTRIDYVLENSYDLRYQNISLGDIVKLNNIGNKSAWLLVKRVSLTNSFDILEDYEVIGQQNATIEFSNKLYNLNRDLGYDTKYSFDNSLYDQSPTIELRIILESLRDNILVDDLRIEYIKTFFNSVHYAMNEHYYVDWTFKTSFLKINHSVGGLKQRITFQSDVLDSYEKFVEEAKPYKSKIREFVSSYDKIDLASEKITDFDLPVSISNVNAITSTGVAERVTLNSAEVNTYPWKDWLENHTYQLVDIVLYDQGDGYLTAPKVIITGDGKGAKATAYIANNKVYRIIVDDPGTDFTKAPDIFISGGNGDNDQLRAKAYAVIGNNKVRTNNISIRYNRTTFAPEYQFSADPMQNDYMYVDTFSGTGNIKTFKLTYAPDIKKVNFDILIDNIQIYGTQYSVSINEKVHGTYTALEGYITFQNAPPLGNNNIVVKYHKNIRLYQAADAINYAYNPTVGQYGKDYGQLMEGIDYGGVQLVSIDFDVSGGWDVLPWDAASWDSIVSDNDDYVVISDGTTRSFDLPYVPKVGEVINIYIDNKRVDDFYYDLYDGSTPQPNGLINAPKGTIMNSFVGNGVNKNIVIPVEYDLLPNSLLTFRKSISDGTILPTDRSLIDSFVSGGNLSYSTATGIAAEDIIIDGDGFVTKDTSHGPEELLQGQVVDSFSIKVFHAPSSGGPNVIVRNYTGDGSTASYALGQTPSTVGGIFVIVNGVISEFIVNFSNKTITLNETPADGDKVVTIVIDTAGYDIVEKMSVAGDGSTKDFGTSARYNGGNISGFVTINGVSTDFEIIEDFTEVKLSDLVSGRTYRIVTVGNTDFTKVGALINESGHVFTATGPGTGTGTVTYNVSGNVIVRFETPPQENDLIQIMLFNGTIKKWSEVTTQIMPITHISSGYALDPVPGNTEPFSSMVLAIVDNQFLQAPDFEYYTYEGNALYINDLRYPTNTLRSMDIDVYSNGTKLSQVKDYNFDSKINAVILNSASVNIGDQVVIEIYKFADFRIIGNELYFNPMNYPIINQQSLSVTTFTNHDVIKIKTINEGFKFITGYDIQQYDTVKYDLTGTAINSSGIFDLPRSVSDTSGVFVGLNRKLLSPNVDYVILDNRVQLKVLLPDILKGEDYIQIITFNDETVKPSYGFKIFKDMINRYHYKRLDSSTTTFLKEPLTYADTSIVVHDASILQDPNRSLNQPGVIEINGERIEYFVKDGDILRQLRRGTLGTGVKNYYEAGTQVDDISKNQSIPYSDKEIKVVHYGDGSTHEFEVDFVPIVREGTVSDDSTITTNWYRETIPGSYGQCDQFEVFVSGKRLRKSPITIYDYKLGQDSFNGAGDKTLEAEFSVNGTSKTIRITEAPSAGETIVIVYKMGNLWQKTTENSSLVFSNTDVARFLRSKQANLPK